MIHTGWFTSSLATLLSMALSAMGIYLALLVFTRLAGLRSFSKMSSFDFAITVAFGSILASTILAKSPALLTGILGLGLLYLIQALVAKSRRLSRLAERMVDNNPLLLMAGSTILEANLEKARITVDDLRSKLRLAGVTHSEQVLAVIMESTGELSVLKQTDRVESWMFANIRDNEFLLAQTTAAKSEQRQP